MKWKLWYYEKTMYYEKIMYYTKNYGTSIYEGETW